MDECDTCGRCGRNALCSIFLFASLFLIKRNLLTTCSSGNDAPIRWEPCEDACCLQKGEGRERGEKKTHSLCAKGIPLKWTHLLDIRVWKMPQTKSCNDKDWLSDQSRSWNFVAGVSGLLRNAFCQVQLVDNWLIWQWRTYSMRARSRMHVAPRWFQKWKSTNGQCKGSSGGRGDVFHTKKREYVRKIEKEKDESGFSLCKVPAVVERDVFHTKWKRIFPL